MKPGRDHVLGYFMEVLGSIGDEWEDRTAVSEDSCILGNLNWRSIEVVYLARAMQQHYGQVFPFEEFLKSVEQRENKDVTIREIVDFVHRNLQDSQTATSSSSVPLPDGAQ